MPYLPFALTAYFFNSISVLIDKFLITKSVPNPLFYVFYISAFSLLALVVLPFSKIPSPEVFVLSSAATMMWTAGSYFMFRALRIGQASRVVPVIGTLIPIGLTLFGILTASLTFNQIWSISLLIIGFIILVAPYLKGRLNLEETSLEVVSALFYISFYLTLRQVYLISDFFTVFAWSRVILVPFLLIIYFVPYFKKKFLVGKSEHHPFKILSRSGILFLVGQCVGGLSELLLTYSISLANPALVNSLQGTQYFYLFIFSFILSFYYPKIYWEKVSKKAMALKIVGIVILFIGIFTVSLYGETEVEKPVIGVTFSPRDAVNLGLDPQKTYLETLDDLKVKNVRIPIYWDQVSPNIQNNDFSDVDFYVNEAAKRNVNVILVIGYKQPRWPECYSPDWITNIPQDNRENRLLNLVSDEITHFRHYSNITVWQVENEPFFHFGECPTKDHLTDNFLEEEVTLVKSLDSRPVLITDSGELSNWVQAIGLSDQFGTTLYRKTWNQITGTSSFPIPPFLYTLKDQTVRLLLHHPGKTIIAELQAEPWGVNNLPIQDEDISTQLQTFTAKDLNNNFSYAKETGFSDIYLWGVEWWFYMRNHGHPEYINAFKSINGIKN